MGVVCQILINKSKGGFKAGQVVTGIVKYAIYKPTEYKAITLSFLGEGKCVWTRKTNNRSRTYVGTEEYITNHIHIQSKEQEPITLDTGSYELPFEFHLPETVPSSFKNRTCTISYRIQLEFEKPSFFSFKKKFSTEIPVIGYVDPKLEGPVIYGLEKSLFHFSGDKPVINLKVENLKTCLTPGENAQLVLVLKNDSDVMPSVRAFLYCYITYTANCGSKHTAIEYIKDCSVDGPDVPARGVANMTLTIPTKAELYTNVSKVMDYEYRVKITVRLPMPHWNAELDIPVTIGERKGEQNFDVLEGEDEKDEPPSYWEAMCEDKDEKKEDET